MDPVAIAPFALTFVLILSGGTSVWIPSLDVTVLQVETSVGIVVATGILPPQYPAGHVTADGWRFASQGAGIFNTFFNVKAGENMWIAGAGGGAFNCSLGYASASATVI